MGRPGDTKLVWDAAIAAEVEAAKKTFDDLTKKGFKAYKVAAGGKAGDPTKTFDAAAEKIILVPPMAGG
jgi:fructose-1,6-bisphosphatase/inositol monophosphatase family enzyme